MLNLSVNPTQANHDGSVVLHDRCQHGYYRDARHLHTPRCPICDPMSEPLTKDETEIALRLMAHARDEGRPKDTLGRYLATSVVEPGKCRCWRCREVLPLDEEHFRRATSKATGFQSRCKRCDNRMRAGRRGGYFREGVALVRGVGHP